METKNRIMFLVAIAATILITVPQAKAQDMPIEDKALFDFFQSIKPDYTMRSQTLRQRRQAEGMAKSKSLRSERPDHVNNQATNFFPPIFNQSGGSCGSCANVAYMLCYENNSLKNQDGKHNTDYQFPSHFTWLTCSNTCPEQTMAERNGIPSVTTYGGQTYSKYFGLQDTEEKDVGWMQGYDKWYSAMFNRARTMGKFPYALDTEEGYELAKDWLWNHNGDTDFQSGGVFVIGVAAGPEYTKFADTPINQECGVVGLCYVTTWGPKYNHALTVCGYDDRVEFDLDSNGVIGEKDKGETGAWIIANSWGQGWASNGIIYCPYKYTYCVGLSGATWDPAFYHARKNYRPLRTIKLLMDYSHRPEILLGAGIAQDTTATKPEESTAFAHFNYTGSAKEGSTEIPMLGRWADGYHYEPMELGYDLTDLSAGFDRTKPLKYFFYIDTKYSSKGSGNIYKASIIDYEFDRQGVEVPFRIDTVAILNRGKTTMISVIVPGEQAYKPLNLVLLNGKTLQWEAPQQSCLKLTGYTIFSNTKEIASVKADQLTYTLNDDAEGTYSVAAIYEVNGEATPSAQSNKVHLTAVPQQTDNTVLELRNTTAVVPDAVTQSMQKATIEFWLYPYTLQAYNQQLGQNWGSFLFHTTYSGNIYVGWNTGANRITTPDGTLKANEWAHIAVTINNNVMTLYVNSVKMGSITSSVYSGLSAFGAFRIGDAYYKFNGKIDELRIWNTCRTQREIANNMRVHIANPTSFPNLITYLAMDKVDGEEGPEIAEYISGHNADMSKVEDYAFLTDNSLLSKDNETPQVDFTLSTDTVFCNQAVEVSTSMSLNTASLQWTAQGATSESTTVGDPTFIFAKPGTYTISLHAANAAGKEVEVSHDITVVSAEIPKADFEIGQDFAPAGDRVSLINRSQGYGCTYEWTIPGAAQSQTCGSNASASYTDTGRHAVTLKATNAAGSSSITKYVTTTNTTPSVDFDILPATVIVGDDITLIDKTKYSPSSWTWNFTNSRHSIGIKGQNFTYKTEYPGYYDVTLTTTNNVGEGTVTKRRVLAVSNADPKNGLNFSGTGETVSLKSPVSKALNGFTFDWWMFPYSKSGALNMSTDDGSLHISTDDNGSTTILLNNKSVSSGDGYVLTSEWHHYAIVYRAGTVVFYRDGEKFMQPTARLALKTQAWTGNLTLGSEETPFRGMIDEFRFWGKALTQDELQATCNQPIANVEEQMEKNALTVYYDFNKGTGNVNSLTSEDFGGTRQGFGPDGDAWSSSLGVFTLDFSPLQEETDITADYLTNYKAPFLHTDERVSTVNYVSRYYQLETGTAQSGWKLENVTTKDGVTTGAYVDTYFNSDLSVVTGSLGFAPSLTDQRTYQTINLPAGLYRIEITEGEKAFSPTGSYIVVTLADTLAGNADLDKTLAYGQLNDKQLEFLLKEDSQVSLGFIFNLSSALSLTIDEIKLIKIPYEFHDAGDLTGLENSEQRIEDNDQSSTLNGQPIYDLNGRKISDPKGIYIRNGKKLKK